MARPEKYIVDYFPHFCNKGKTMFILESRYGNDGYAFWFKLLELLATTRGHYYDASDSVQKEYLGALTRFPGGKTTDILGLLAQIDAIDKELWEQHNVIWCENLVKNVEDVYENRKGLLPHKPYYDGVKLRQNIDNHNINPISSIDNTQTKLNKTKLNKTKLNKTKEKEETALPSFIDKNLWNDFMEMRRKKKVPNTARAKSLLIKHLTEFNQQGFDANKIIEDSIMRGWTGVFTSGQGEGRNGKTKLQPRALPKQYTKFEDL